MELVEHIQLKPAYWLSKLTYNEFISTCLDETKKRSVEERKNSYSNLLQFCQTVIKNKGQTTRVYSYATGNFGRLFSGGSLQGLPSAVRGLFMCNGVGTDIDMCNAHPVILKYICKLHDITCPHLDFYINNRDKCLSKFASREIGKTMYLTSLNKDSLNRNKDLPNEFKNFDIEIKQIQKKIITIHKYKDIISSVPESKTFNKIGSAVNRILCYYENIILHHAIHIIKLKHIEIVALMFDGLMIYGDYYEDHTLLTDISTHVEKQMDGLNMEWCYKEHSNKLQIPDDFTFIEEPINNNNNFQAVVNNFEKSHLKIINKSLFIKHDNNNIIFLTSQQLKMSYAHLYYDEVICNEHGICIEVKKMPFITKWIGHTHDIRRKDDIDIYPNQTDCPDNIFNLWCPFDMELLTEPYTTKTYELNFILNHIKILCGHDENVYDYFIKWIAQMIQYPHIKSIMPTFISKEGAGKGTMFKLFEKMLGSKKIFETTNPSRDVWGDFNSVMCNCFLVNLNELSKKDTMEAEGRIKSLITDYSLVINQKGLPQYKIKSYHRFIATTNNEEPITSTNGDRRNLIIRSSDEKKGDVNYFSTIHNYLEDINVVKTCYEYFKSIEGMDNFHRIPLPQTKHQTNLKELSKSPIELWLESFTREHLDDKQQTIELFSSEVYELFTQWCDDNGIKYSVNSCKLGVRLFNMNICGVYKGTHTSKGNKKLFNITELKESLNL